MIAMTGLALVALSLLMWFTLESYDPYQDFFPWAFRLAEMIFISGAILMFSALATYVLRLFV